MRYVTKRVTQKVHCYPDCSMSKINEVEHFAFATLNDLILGQTRLYTGQCEQENRYARGALFTGQHHRPDDR